MFVIKMIKIKRCVLWGMLVFMLCSMISNISARTDVYELEPSSEVTRDITLTVQDSVVGNLSVGNGVIDFYVTNPSEGIVFYYDKTTYANFTFNASEDGNYTFHFINLNSSEGVTVTMIYSVNFSVFASVGLNVGTSVGTAVVSSPPPFDPGSPEKPDLEDPYRRYLTFLGAEQIINMLEEIWDCMPVGISLFGLVLLTGALLIRKRQRFRPLKPFKKL